MSVDERTHPEPRRSWAWRRACDQPTAWIEEARLLLLVELDSIAVLVDKPMVMTAQADQIPERRLATIGPVVDVVTLDEDPIAATGKRHVLSRFNNARFIDAGIERVFRPTDNVVPA